MNALTAEEAPRFWVRVQPTGFCWDWTGGLTDGYGRFNRYQRGVGITPTAHRIAYETLVGSIADGMELDHLCRNRACVNPDHMDPVPTRVNLERGYSPSAINARRTACKNGHALTAENVYPWRGKRYCRECRRTRPRTPRPKVNCPTCGYQLLPQNLPKHTIRRHSVLDPA